VAEHGDASADIGPEGSIILAKFPEVPRTLSDRDASSAKLAAMLGRGSVGSGLRTIAQIETVHDLIDEANKRWRAEQAALAK
jgi:hypothetical protein